MKTLLRVIVIAALCFFAYHYFTDRPKQNNIKDEPEVAVNKPDLHSESQVWLIKRASITTDSGVTGISPGTPVTVISKNGESVIVEAAGIQLEVPSSSLSNSEPVALEARSKDRSSQVVASQASLPSSNVVTGPTERLHLYVVRSVPGGLIGDPILFIGSGSGIGSAGGAAGESFVPVVRSGNYVYVEGYPSIKTGQEIVVDARPAGFHSVDGQTLPKWTWTTEKN